MPKPKADMSQRIKNAGFQKQSAKAMKGGSPQFGIPQQPVNNYYYYGTPPPQQSQEKEEPQKRVVFEDERAPEPEPSPDGSINSDYDYQEEVMMPQNQLKYRFA